ncbi:MAG: hypothetical protein ABSG69_15415 [Candidatus Acidiferrum sp.]|jgi:hypothetical protein
MNRNVLGAILATAAVLAVLILGFRDWGSPTTQRMKQADLRKVQALQQIAQEIWVKWNSKDQTLPGDWNALETRGKKDPVSGKPFGYHAKSGSRYELCATFLTDQHRAVLPGNVDEFWEHPQGDYCFQLDATQAVPQAPYY